ncbi:DsbA family protein [Kordiimonas sp. SCSIO 12610]|uniref:DsbA family protein n=1 Tax=Kordiimonas sp. SCSIO 12610 TaxID=2829597 RepID=UPI002109B0C7|nr:DsbA family protein [Kordiimonas sp. SCSIO 12610]UTW54370.1 DsbA family protein [Kordiimonas sp. SCSIO 12610]
MDIKSPYAFVAYRQILALEKKLGLEFDWRPLTLDIPSYLGSAEKKDGQVISSKARSQHTWNMIKYSYHDARRYAERQGLVLKGTEKIWDSSIVNIGILWAAQKNRKNLSQYFEAVYPAFWRRELNIENTNVVMECLEQAGVNSDGFEDYQADEGREIHDRLSEHFHNNGIYGVPTFVLDGEVLFGREHIPYIRWMLSGCKGEMPDIAYEIAPC